MSDKFTEVFTDIANAIREKDGSTAKMKPDAMAGKIKSITTGIEPTGTKNITENGTYDVTNYASAVVDVAGSGGGDQPKLNAPTIAVSSSNKDVLTITYPASNGDFDTGINIYNGETIVKSYSTLPSSVTLTDFLSLNTLYELSVAVTGTNVLESDKSNAVNWEKNTYTITTDSYITCSISKSGYIHYGETLSCTFTSSDSGRYLNPEIVVKTNGEATNSYTYSCYDGTFSMTDRGVLTISIDTTTLQPLTPPTAKISGENLTWNAVTGATGYMVVRTNQDTGVSVTIAESTTEMTLDIGSGISAEDKTEYRFKVKALGDGTATTNSTFSSEVTFSRGIMVYGVSFAGNALDGTRIDACDGVTNDQVGIGYYGESSKASNWFDDKAPFQFEIVNLKMRDSSGTALVDATSGEAITAPFVKRKNFYVKITDHTDDDGQTWEVATGAKDGFSPMVTNFDGTIPEYIYQSVYPFSQLNTSSGTWYGAQRGRQVLYSHDYNSAGHYSKCAYVGNEDGLTLAPLITLRKCMYDVNVVLFLIEFASRNSQRFFNNQYGNYGRSSTTSGSTYVGVLDSVSSSSATYAQTTPYSQTSTYSTSDQVYKYRGVECCFNTYSWVVGDVAFYTGDSSGRYWYKASSLAQITGGNYASFDKYDKGVGCNSTYNLATKIGFKDGMLFKSATDNSSTYNSIYYCDAVRDNSTSYPLLLVGGLYGNSYSLYGAFYCSDSSWGSSSDTCASRPCLSVA